MDPIDPRPVVHALMAYPLGIDRFTGEPRFTEIRRVPLAQALYFMELGFWIVGPDPADIQALARWEREHR